MSSSTAPATIIRIRKNKVLSVLPFGGFIKTGALAFYDSFLYRPTLAQVDLKKQNTQALVPVEKSLIRFGVMQHSREEWLKKKNKYLMMLDI